MNMFVAGGLAGVAMCFLYRYVPFWLAVPLNFFIWIASGSLVGAWP